jgi:hypothetical protein
LAPALPGSTYWISWDVFEWPIVNPLFLKVNEIWANKPFVAMAKIERIISFFMQLIYRKKKMKRDCNKKFRKKIFKPY